MLKKPNVIFIWNLYNKNVVGGACGVMTLFFLIWLHYFYYCCSFRTGDCMESHFAYVTLLGFCSETWIQKPCFPPCQANIRCVCVCLMVALPTAGFTARHPGWWQKILGCLSRARWIALLLLLFLFCLDSVENVYSIQLKTAALFKVSV